MFLEFRVNNYRSIKDTAVISMFSKEKTNSFSVKKYDLLQSAVIYGANASGKSNLLRALSFMKRYVLNTDKVMQSTDTLPHDPFLLNSETENSSSLFEIVFFIDNIKYRYGFEADERTVYSEWLFEDQTGRKEATLFQRDVDESLFYINPTRFKEGASLKVRDNQLFLWKCDQEGGNISKKILQWFTNLNFIDGLEHRDYINYTMKELKKGELSSDILSLMKAADMGIKNFRIAEEEIPKEILELIPLPDDVKRMLLSDSKASVISADVKTMHKKYDKDNRLLKEESIFDLHIHESEGTRKFFALSAPILDTLKCGGILLVDELDASLHPLLTRKLIALFHDKKVNTQNAQLIFATHDTNLLNSCFFSREQIWFAEKDIYEATYYTSLLEIAGVRKSDNYEKNYIMGKYGAIPYLGNFNYEEKYHG